VSVSVHHDLAHGVVREEALERPVAEDVVGELPDELTPLLSRQRRPGEGELLGDRPVDAVSEVVWVLLEQLGAELRDAGVVDAGLELGVRVDGGLLGCGVAEGLDRPC
jgi:hypothetical protein